MGGTGRISQSLSDLERVVGRAKKLVTKVQQQNDDGYLNVYTFNLRALRLHQLTQSLRTCYQRLSAEVTGFTAFLSDLEKIKP